MMSYDRELQATLYSCINDIPPFGMYFEGRAWGGGGVGGRNGYAKVDRISCTFCRCDIELTCYLIGEKLW